METIVIIVILVVLFFLFGSSNKGKPGRVQKGSKKTSTYQLLTDQEIQSEAEEIVKKITTPSGVLRLEERVEKASERVAELDGGSPQSYNKAIQKLQILEMAFSIAEDMPLKYVYIPDSDPFESKVVLKEGYRVISRDKKEEIERNFPGKGYFEELGYYELEDENPVEAVSGEDEAEANNALIKLRTIVEGKAKHETKVKNINNWVEEHSGTSHWEVIDLWYDTEDLEKEITPGDAFYIAELLRMDCPTDEELYLQGYKQPNDYLSLDLDEFGKRHGIGVKTVEQMRVFQNRVQSQSETLESLKI